MIFSLDGIVTLVGRGLNWEGTVKDTFNPEKPRPKLISKNQKQTEQKTPPHKTHTHTKNSTTVMKLFKVQYSEEYDPNKLIRKH